MQFDQKVKTISFWNRNKSSLFLLKKRHNPNKEQLNWLVTIRDFHFTEENEEIKNDQSICGVALKRYNLMRENQTAHFNAIFLRRRHNAISYGLWLVAWSGLDWPYLKIICDDFCEIPRNFDCEHKKKSVKNFTKHSPTAEFTVYFISQAVLFVLF